MRLMGLDFGSKTVGVAVSDPLGITAQPLETVCREKENQLRKTLQRLEELIKEYGVSLIVLGLPKNMDDSNGERVTKTLEFKEMLERRTGLEIYMQDERLTTMQAERVMEALGVKKKDMKKNVDNLAAAIILQTYMDSHK